MKKIALFNGGSVGFIDTESHHSVQVDGKPPIQYLDATEKNIKKYFKKIDIENLEKLTKSKKGI